MSKKTIYFLFLFFTCTAASSQDLPTDSALTRIFKRDLLLPVLIDSAIQNSAEYKRAGQNIALLEQNLHTTQKSILNTINLNTLYGYGNAGNLAIEKDPTMLNPYMQSSTLQTSRFNLGVSVQVPLGNLFSRKNTVRSAALQVEMAESEKASSELFIRQQVIRFYQEVKLAHSILLTSGKMHQSTHVNMSMGQKAFVDGQISLEQFAKLQNEYNQSVIHYETQVNRFQTAFLLLEAYTGVRLTKLIMQVK